MENILNIFSKIPCIEIVFNGPKHARPPLLGVLEVGLILRYRSVLGHFGGGIEPNPTQK